MLITIQKSKVNADTKVIQITGSKSESNRLLLLQALYPELCISNLSNAEDTDLMRAGLSAHASVIDVHHAGTAMRFLTAYYACKADVEVTLTGSTRMKERPIEILVEALKSLGADIQYLENDGYPPIRIRGKSLVLDQVSLQANVSSQYISALLLIAPKLTKGLEIHLEGNLTSKPYVEMTLDLLRQLGAQVEMLDSKITVLPLKAIKKLEITVESDWSSASYFYSMIALSTVGTSLKLSSFNTNSLQGDAALQSIYRAFGVQTTFEHHSIVLQKTDALQANKHLSLDLSQCPDIAQTIVVTCFGLGWSCDINGLHTLKIKETDRLLALQNELCKLGAMLQVTNDSLVLKAHDGLKLFSMETEGLPVIATYNDHRMAMAFAPLALRMALQIEDHRVVNKSYPDFWTDLKTIGFHIG